MTKELVFINNGQAITDSLTIAEMFCKRHDNVLRDIKEVLEKLNDHIFRNEAGSLGINLGSLKFEETPYVHHQNKKTFYMYNLNFDAFMLVTMGYTTQKAMLIKLKYINEFNRMQQALKTISAPSYMIDDPIERANVWIKEQQEKKLLEQKLIDNESKVTYYDTILKAVGAMTVTQIAADYDLTAYALNKILKEAKVQRKVGKQWVLLKEYMSKGYVLSETIPIVRKDGTPDTQLNTKWTQKGRLFIHKILTQKGYIPLMDRIREAN